MYSMTCKICSRKTDASPCFPQSGITHSLDFPIDMENEATPALEVLIAACKSHATCEMDRLFGREPLFYPPNLPLTASLELANHPIMDAIRTAFPSLISGPVYHCSPRSHGACPHGRTHMPSETYTQGTFEAPIFHYLARSFINHLYFRMRARLKTLS